MNSLALHAAASLLRRRSEHSVLQGSAFAASLGHQALESLPPDSHPQPSGQPSGSQWNPGPQSKFDDPKSNESAIGMCLDFVLRDEMGMTAAAACADGVSSGPAQAYSKHRKILHAVVHHLLERSQQLKDPALAARVAAVTEIHRRAEMCAPEQNDFGLSLPSHSHLLPLWKSYDRPVETSLEVYTLTADEQITQRPKATWFVSSIECSRNITALPPRSSNVPSLQTIRDHVLTGQAVQCWQLIDCCQGEPIEKFHSKEMLLQMCQLENQNFIRRNFEDVKVKNPIDVETISVDQVRNVLKSPNAHMFLQWMPAWKRTVIPQPRSKAQMRRMSIEVALKCLDVEVPNAVLTQTGELRATCAWKILEAFSKRQLLHKPRDLGAPRDQGDCSKIGAIFCLADELGEWVPQSEVPKEMIARAAFYAWKVPNCVKEYSPWDAPAWHCEISWGRLRDRLERAGTTTVGGYTLSGADWVWSG